MVTKTAMPHRRLSAVLTGAAAGLVGGLALTLLQALGRLALGVSPPAELIGDRIAPLLSIDQFFGLFDLLGGYNALKQTGVGANTAGQLALGVGLGVVYALRARPRPPVRLLAVLTAVVWLVLVVALWPNLGSSYVGLSPLAGYAVTLIFMAVSFAVFVLVVVYTYRLLRSGSGRTADRTQAAKPSGDRADSALRTRREALIVAGAGLGLAVATGAAGTALFRRATFGYDGTQVRGRVIDAITPNDRFYTVTKNVIDPDVDADRWRFEVSGAVNQSRSWGLAELRAMPPVTQETTLMCISNFVGGGLESNAMWTGVPLRELLRAAGPVDGVLEVLLTAVDGYTDTFSVDKAMDPTTLLAWEMNGVPLPRRHGYPARLIVPGMFGEKNLKWITRVDLVTEDAKGFYENQGWGPNFVIPTRSRFVDPQGGARPRLGEPVTLQGTAFGGNRGVRRVEVSTDGGTSWQDAVITYPGTRLSWALWRYQWQPTAVGAATLVVRATDDTGSLQNADDRGIAPMGATGLHRLDVTVV